MSATAQIETRESAAVAVVMSDDRAMEIVERLGAIFGEVKIRYEEAGALIVEIDRAGRSDILNRYPAGLIKRLRAVGEGRLVPEVMSRVSRPVVVDVMARLPVIEQRAIVADGFRVTVVVADQDAGTYDRIQIPVDALAAAQRSQVFAPDHVRSEAEQRAWLDRAHRDAEEKQMRGPKVRLSVPVTGDLLKKIEAKAKKSKRSVVEEVAAAIAAWVR